MSYSRLVNRNALRGDYDSYERSGPINTAVATLNGIRGDMRRFEKDCRADDVLSMYAEKTGLTPEQVKSVFDVLLDADYGDPDFSKL
jgi:hypothetical protein